MSAVAHPANIASLYPWFEHDWQEFVAQYQAQRVPHAWLLKSPEGMGAGHLAQAMAGYLLCRAPADAIACGQCRSCQLLATGSGA